MIFTSNISTRSTVCSCACAALVLMYVGVAVSFDMPHEAKASVSAGNSTSQAFSVTSEDSSAFDFRAVDTPKISLSSTAQTSDQLNSLESVPEASPSTQTDETKTPKEIHKDAQDRAQYSEGDTPVMTRTDKTEILWLARIVYSETKRPHEQRLVAWVVRNRVDTGYTGRTYEAVANHSSQFSGLQPSDPRYEHNISRWWESSGTSWKSALKIAKEVYFAPESERPFSVTTRHFYSPVAVSKPDWARGREAVRVVRSSSAHAPRFAFYARVR